MVKRFTKTEARELLEQVTEHTFVEFFSNLMFMLVAKSVDEF